jgi:hypothetical protein
MSTYNRMSVWLTKFPVMTLDGRMLYFTSATTIRQLLEALIKGKIYKRNKGKQERDKG